MLSNAAPYWATPHQNSLSGFGFLPDFVSVFSIIPLNQNNLDQNSFWTFVINWLSRLKQSWTE
jgi:hypothetical protein